MSETTQKSKKSWLVIGLCTLVLSTLGLSGIENARRQQGHHASVRDDADLWALQYRRAKKHGRAALALIGTSRMLYGMDPQTLKNVFPNQIPIMLANNGAYPIASLKLLAQDPAFTGDVLMDIDGRGLAHYYFDMQPQVILAAKTGLSPSTSINRRWQLLWQQHTTIAQQQLGLPALISRKLFGAAPPLPNHVRMFADRSAMLDFQTPNLPVEAMRANFAAGVLADQSEKPPPNPAQYLADLAPVAGYLRMLAAKGARVWIFASPTTGEHRAADEQGYPRAQYWDRFAVEIAEKNGACAINAQDVPAISMIALPDGSHIDQRDRARYTQALADRMQQCRFRR